MTLYDKLFCHLCNNNTATMVDTELSKPFCNSSLRSQIHNTHTSSVSAFANMFELFLHIVTGG